LEVQVESIIVKLNESSWSATVGNPFKAVIDSTLPYISLPRPVCSQIADKLGLIPTNTNSGYQLYTINQTQRARNYQQVQNIQISITNTDALGNPSGPFNGTTITFPYAAFDLNATWPISLDNVTSYFPIIPAPTDTFILGRTFLQEAYVIADFDRQNFSVYQSKFPGPNVKATLVPIYNSSVEAQLNTKLSGRAIAGIVVGCFFFVVIVVGIVVSIWQFWFVKKRREKGIAERAKRTDSRGHTYSSLSGITANDSMELEATISGAGPHHRRELSELSSDAEHERGRRMNALGSTVIEMEDKSDATQLQLNALRMSEMPQPPPTPQEME